MSILHGLAAPALAAASPLSLAQTTCKVEPSRVATDNVRMLGEVQRVAITLFVVQFLDRQSNASPPAAFAAAPRPRPR